MMPPLKWRLLVAEIRQVDIARAAGVSKSYVNRIVNGKQKASAKVAKAFWDMAGIPIELWL
ncbi:MAG: helix-turn-helix transcriptional regulator [Chloroflexi bacterium]|nr:helix-turn-helix transcriptional regulator [Chloroflexota bacterium]